MSFQLLINVIKDGEATGQKDLWEIFEPENDAAWRDLSTHDERMAYAYEHHMVPATDTVTMETYSRDAERKANYELENLTLINAKAKHEFTWTYLKYTYARNLLNFLGVSYNYTSGGEITPREAPEVQIQVYDFTGVRVVKTYVGQTIEGELKNYDEVLYWENLRIAFVER